MLFHVFLSCFDPLNNIWKPSGGSTQRSSSASAYAPQPAELEAPYFEEEVIRAQYSTWAGHYHGENKEQGSFQQKSLVQIEYNKRTGEDQVATTREESIKA